MIIKAKKAIKQGGLTLIESLVVVGILLGIIAIALTLYGTVMDRINVKNESENLSLTYAQVLDIFSDEQTDDLDNALAIQSGIFPTKMKKSGTSKVYNSWDGAVTINGVNGKNGFTLEYQKVPSGKVCVDLVRNQRKVGWDKVTVAGTAIMYSALKNTTLATACDKSTDNIVIVFEKTDT